MTGKLVLGDEFENPDGLEVTVDVKVTKVEGDDDKKDDSNKDDNKNNDDHDTTKNFCQCVHCI